jgi:hypothetical protein
MLVFAKIAAMTRIKVKKSHYARDCFTDIKPFQRNKVIDFQKTNLMKFSRLLSPALFLFALSTVLSSCYVGYYQPYPRPVYGPHYQSGPRYNRGGGSQNGGHYHGGGYRGGNQNQHPGRGRY